MCFIRIVHASDMKNLLKCAVGLCHVKLVIMWLIRIIKFYMYAIVVSSCYSYYRRYIVQIKNKNLTETGIVIITICGLPNFKYIDLLYQYEICLMA